MATNHSMLGDSLQHQFTARTIIVQILIMIFLCINLVLVLTFFSKALFYTMMRYILFAVTLLSDSLILIISDILLILTCLNVTMRVGLCSVIYIVLSLYTFVTPVTLTAMTLERYVAICMPLRHGELCSTRSALYSVLIIQGLSSVPCLIVLCIFFASVTHSFYTQGRICSVEMFISHKWQGDLRSTINQFYFLMMFIAIVFSYVKIMKVALAASGENKKSTWKGLRTVILHGFQLLLCLIQLWCPFIEAAVLQINFMLYVNVRYYNYITFIIAPRCLSPLIYGLRDEMFYQALKYYALCGLYKKQSSDLF